MKRYAPSAILMVLLLSGCHTSASFMLPPSTDLLINGERVTFNAHDEEGRVKLERRPFFWTSIAGIEYSLVQEDKIIKKAKLPSGFRISSIFWPPYAYIYWPVGFRFECYDLTDTKKEFVEKCAMRDEQSRKMETHPSTTTQ
jgi:hypothetical protein